MTDDVAFNGILTSNIAEDIAVCNDEFIEEELELNPAVQHSENYHIDSAKTEDQILGQHEDESDIGKPSPSESGLSKRQIRKQKKFERLKQHRKEKRAEEKLRQKEKNWKLAIETGQTPRMKREFLKGALERSVDVNIVFDLNFAALMSEKDAHKVAKQVHRCYSVNRASEKPLKIHLTGIDESMKKVFQHCAPGYEFWQMSSQTEQPYEEFFKMQIENKKLHYLTAESDNCMDTIEHGKYYVIGGLVDHNAHKGHCHKLATEKLVQTMRLPISEHIDMKTRHVLTINHVFEILLAKEQGKEWKEALREAIPQRKGVQGKDEDELKAGDAAET